MSRQRYTEEFKIEAVKAHFLDVIVFVGIEVKLIAIRPPAVGLLPP